MLIHLANFVFGKLEPFNMLSLNIQVLVRSLETHTLWQIIILRKAILNFQDEWIVVQDFLVSPKRSWRQSSEWLQPALPLLAIATQISSLAGPTPRASCADFERHSSSSGQLFWSVENFGVLVSRHYSKQFFWRKLEDRRP